MFVMLVYDVPSERTRIFRKIARRYIGHEQASVYWGAMPRSEFVSLKKELSGAVRSGDRVTLLHAENRHNVAITELSRKEGVPGPASSDRHDRHTKDSLVL